MPGGLVSASLAAPRKSFEISALLLLPCGQPA